MGPIGSPETSVLNYRMPLNNLPPPPQKKEEFQREVYNSEWGLRKLEIWPTKLITNLTFGQGRVIGGAETAKSMEGDTILYRREVGFPPTSFCELSSERTKE
jgi:hypothetical protein